VGNYLLRDVGESYDVVVGRVMLSICFVNNSLVWTGTARAASDTLTGHRLV
jgi:hypothetical protein